MPCGLRGVHRTPAYFLIPLFSWLLSVSVLGLTLYLGWGVDAYSENGARVACAELIRKPTR